MREGEEHPLAILTEAEVVWARREVRTKGCAVSVLADILDVPRAALRSAVAGRTWHCVDQVEPPVMLQRPRRPSAVRPDAPHYGRAHLRLLGHGRYLDEERAERAS